MATRKKNPPPYASRPSPLPAETQPILTTNQGLPISNHQNSLKAGEPGAGLLEDFILREKITQFDHEQIPERIVHARGSGANGYFQTYRSQADATMAKFLRDPEKRTEAFKMIGYVRAAQPLLDAASIGVDDGILPVSDRKSVVTCISPSKSDGHWDHEPKLRSIG